MRGIRWDGPWTGMAHHGGSSRVKKQSRARFGAELVFTAAVRNGPGEITKVQSFDPTAEETLWIAN